MMPTHRVPAGGLPAWTRSDASLPPAATLDPGLEVQLVSRWGDWANISCTNGWTAWVDGRRLELLAGGPATPTAAPGPPRPHPGLLGSIQARPGSSRSITVAGRPVEIGAVVGAALVALASMLDWVSVGGVSASGFDVKTNFLFSPTSKPSGVDLGLVLLAAAIGAVALSVLGSRRREGRWIGVAVAAVAVLFAVQMQRSLSQLTPAHRPSLLGTLGIGVYLTLLGGGLMAVPAAGERR